MYAALTALRDALAALPWVTTCRIGMEANMTPADYPMVRIVPSVARYGSLVQSRACEVLVYFGRDVHEFDAGMEALYEQLLSDEAEILAAAGAAVRFDYVETIFDEDRVDAYKLLAIRATVESV